jgi:hypothetical protein
MIPPTTNNDCTDCKYLHIQLEYSGATTGIEKRCWPEREEMWCVWHPEWLKVNKNHWCGQWKEYNDKEE